MAQPLESAGGRHRPRMTPAGELAALRHAFLGGASPQALRERLDSLERALDGAFASVEQRQQAAGEAALGGTIEAREALTDLLHGLARDLERARTSSVLPVLQVAEQVIMSCLPPGAGEDAAPATAAAVAAPATAAAVAAPATLAAGGRLPRALVVDDETAFAAILQSWLQDLGYEVTTCARADDARRHLDAGGWKVLVSDIVMPGGGDGFDLAGRAHERDPAIAVVLVSGYVPPRARAEDAQRWPLLRKPFQRADLDRAVNRALGHAQAGAAHAAP